MFPRFGSSHSLDYGLLTLEGLFQNDSLSSPCGTRERKYLPGKDIAVCWKGARTFSARSHGIGRNAVRRNQCRSNFSPQAQLGYPVEFTVPSGTHHSERAQPRSKPVGFLFPKRLCLSWGCWTKLACPNHTLSTHRILSKATDNEARPTKRRPIAWYVDDPLQGWLLAAFITLTSVASVGPQCAQDAR